jgi:hypothetical protein
VDAAANVPGSHTLAEGIHKLMPGCDQLAPKSIAGGATLPKSELNVRRH